MTSQALVVGDPAILDVNRALRTSRIVTNSHKTVRIPTGCAAVGCTNNQVKSKELSFYRFPAEQDRRDKWL